MHFDGKTAGSGEERLHCQGDPPSKTGHLMIRPRFWMAELGGLDETFQM
jgi:hypothetical protein